MNAIFVLANGEEVEVDVDPGTSLMRAATANGIPGILADCGGTASCATCHVRVDPTFVDKLEPISSSEDQMLDCTAAERQSNSRLSCQILMSEQIAGIKVFVADPQV